MLVIFVNLFFAGVLAGVELVVRYGLRGPIESLDDATHIRLRQALVLVLRILVPALFFPALGTGIAAAVLGDDGFSALALRCGGILALVIWLAVTFGGTVPINSAALTWQPESPPDGWRALIDRWERLAAVRTWMALLASVCFLAAEVTSTAR